MTREESRKELGVERPTMSYELLSNYMPEALEAFAVVIYANNYKKFLQEHWKYDSGELSSVSGGAESTESLFTSDGRGAGKYDGWSEDGMELYNRIFGVVERQRKRPERKALKREYGN
jgi:hypothetical protein